jgi:DNA (cytosine-5)-methyltransferase 1
MSDQLSDVRGADLKRIDAITFGSPCQDFSLAGKRKGLGGDRSSLIGEAIRLISECRPRFFIWENVKGTFSSNDGADFWAIIQAFANIGDYRLEWQLLNTKWFLPQNRERIYLVGYIGDGSKGQVFPIGESVGENDDKIKRVTETQ